MMAVLLHDIGNLTSREEHALIGGKKLVEQIPGTEDFRIDNIPSYSILPIAKSSVPLSLATQVPRYRGTMQRIHGRRANRRAQGSAPYNCRIGSPSR